MTYLDGNAAAGEMLELFDVDLTVATGRCEHCGHTAVMAEARLYDPEMGPVLRCAGCEAVLMRVVVSDDRVWLDLRGLTYLEVPRSAAPAPPA